MRNVAIASMTSSLTLDEMTYGEAPNSDCVASGDRFGRSRLLEFTGSITGRVPPQLTYMPTAAAVLPANFEPHCYTGFLFKDFDWNPRLAYDPPPFFPNTTPWKLESWQCVREDTGATTRCKDL